MDSRKFLVQGSADEPYTVIFTKTDNDLTVSCSCPGAKFEKHCKHRLRLLTGDATGIISGNADCLCQVKDMICDTQIEVALERYLLAEQEVERAKKRLSKAKKDLSKLLKSDGLYP